MKDIGYGVGQTAFSLRNDGFRLPCSLAGCKIEKIDETFTVSCSKINRKMFDYNPDETLREAAAFNSVLRSPGEGTLNVRTRAERINFMFLFPLTLILQEATSLCEPRVAAPARGPQVG